MGVGNGRSRIIARLVFFSLLFGLIPAVSPVGPFIGTAQATTCTPFETTFAGDSSTGVGTTGTTYQLLIFTNSTDCTWSVPSGVVQADLLLIGGGGGGYGLAGGGAGEYLQRSSHPISGSVTIRAGAGGASFNSGASSQFGDLVASGGGRGGDRDNDAPDNSDGGSAGGSNTGSREPGDSLDDLDANSFGFAGSKGFSNPSPWLHPVIGGGGGGAGNSPANATYVGGVATSLGGPGRTSAILPAAIASAQTVGEVYDGEVYFAGGGGGGCGNGGCSGSNLAGGLGGGGDGNAGPEDGAAATGGGGGGTTTYAGTAGAGGSGVVIVRYALVTVRYDKNQNQHQSGSVAGTEPTSTSARSGSTYTVLGNSGSLTRTGFTFEGWNDASDGSGNTYLPNATLTLSADITLYAQWGIPGAARLFGQTLDDDPDTGVNEDSYRSETVRDVVGYPGLASEAYVRGITNDGQYVYYLPSRAPSGGKAQLFRVNFGSSDETVDDEADFDTLMTVVDDPTRPGGVAALNGTTAQRDLAYSSGCIFVRGGTATVFNSTVNANVSTFPELYCVDISQTNVDGEYVAYEITLDVAMPVGDLYLTGNILDFGTGEIAVVGQNRGENSDSDCPDGFDCKVLRIYNVAGEGSSVSVTHAKDVLLADSESTTDTCSYAEDGWPCDNHGVASDGTYFFQSNHEYGYRTWALPQGSDVVGYLVFDGDGTADLDGSGASARAVGGHNADCGADDGVSGGFCPINPENDGADRSTWNRTTHRQMVNTTFFSRDHTSKRYIMGDFAAPRFLLSRVATDQPQSQYQPPTPSAPGSISATPANQSARLSWSASTISGSGSISYTVTSSPGGFSCTTSSTTCQITGLSNGTAYTFSVVALVGSVTSSATVSEAITPTIQVSTSSPGSSVNSPEATPTSPIATPRQTRLTLVGPSTIPVPRPVERLGLRFDPDAPSRATVGGVPANLVKIPVGSDGLSVTAGAFQFGVSLADADGGEVQTDTPSRSPELFVPREESVAVSGKGSYPGSFVQLFLPGNGDDSLELARIPVRSDGTYASDLSFQAGALELPVPIGRQVLQVVGYDELGIQTVVDMTVNIGQGVPAPEPNRQAGALPALTAGQSLATSGGIPETVSVTGVPEAGNVVVEGTGWVISVNADRDNGVVETKDGNVLVRLNPSSVGTTSGNGFLPRTLATVWLFSEPTLVATVSVDDAGEFSAEFLVDQRLIAPGEHTLQVQGVGSDGYIKAANLGVLVEEPVELTTESASTMLWWVVGTFVLALVLLLFVLARKRRREA